MRVLIAAGGTAGHVNPALATADVLRHRGHHVEFAGGDRMEATAVPAADFKLHQIPGRPFGSNPVRAAAAAASLAAGVVRSRKLIREGHFDAVLGMGGYHSAAPCIAGRMLGRAVVLHEQNARLARAHRVALRSADVLAYSVPIPERIRIPTRRTGNPLRREIAQLAQADPEERSAVREAALRRFEFNPDKPVVLVTGGSLGSAPINRAITSRTSRYSGEQIIHLCGPAHATEVEERWDANPNVRVYGYLPDMVNALACADLVVTRAGGAVAEFLACGIPAVLVPGYFAAGRHQHANAAWMVSAGAALEVDERAADFADVLADAVSALTSSPDRLAAMSSAARAAGIPDAAEQLSDLVEQTVGQRA